MKLTFLGATNTVTGSKYLLTLKKNTVLVDCGLFQGYKNLRLRNWSKLPIDLRRLDAVLITHAHIDHTGYLPALVKQGFKGPIYATKATHDLCRILLPDSGYLQEEDARRANKYGYTKHHPAIPLYTKADAEVALKQFIPVDFDKAYKITDDLSVHWHRAGHILGSAFVQCQFDNNKTLLFSGDIGRLKDPIMKPSAVIQNADYLVLESTYGDRLHENTDPAAIIERIVKETAKRGGTILIPAFAVGRAQSLLYYLYCLKKKNAIPNLPIYLDSPMAVSATQLMYHHNNELRLSKDQCSKVCSVATYINTPEESREIGNKPMPKIIISASGMATGGRVLHHLKILAPDPKNTILFTGFQASGTRGASMLAGKSVVKIHGEMIPIKAHIAYLSNISAHADYEEILVWLKKFTRAPQQVFITHGEPDAALSLKTQINNELKWSCSIPNYLDTISL